MVTGGGSISSGGVDTGTVVFLYSRMMRGFTDRYVLHYLHGGPHFSFLRTRRCSQNCCTCTAHNQRTTPYSIEVKFHYDSRTSDA